MIKLTMILITLLPIFSFAGGNGGGGGARPGLERFTAKPKITLLSHSNNIVSFATATPSIKGWKVDTYMNIDVNILDQNTLEKLYESNSTKNWVELN